MKNALITLSISSFLGVLALGVFLYSGLIDVSATAHPGSLTKWLMTSIMHATVERQGKSIEVPDLNKKSLVLEGINDFEAMCSTCHGAPGKGPGPMGQGLNPPAPDLQEAAHQHTPGELFWVVKNGIKMTGMPAWGVSHEDESLWPVIAFLTALPDLNAETYAALLKRAEGTGHHAAEEMKENNAPESVEMEHSMKQPKNTHEHHDHEH